MTRPILCYVTDRAGLRVESGVSREDALIARIGRAVAAGVDWIELREKDLDSRMLLELTRRAVAVRDHASSGARTAILVNNRLDVALAAGADGVHLAERSLPLNAVTEWRRRAMSESENQTGRFLVGASCHSRESAERAAQGGADYIFFGPVFATPSKAPFGPPQGLEKLSGICHAVKIPVIAIGGITIENARMCVQVGAAGIAAIALFQRADNLEETVAALRETLAR